MFYQYNANLYPLSPHFSHFLLQESCLPQQPDMAGCCFLLVLGCLLLVNSWCSHLCLLPHWVGFSSQSFAFKYSNDICCLDHTKQIYSILSHCPPLATSHGSSRPALALWQDLHSLFLSLCHLYPLPVTWRIQMRTSKEYLFSCILLTTLATPKRNE
jgi:hypothetical protein